MDAAWVGIGGNLGDVRATLDGAVRRLAALPAVTGCRRSSLFRSRPVGAVADQPWFLNGVVELRLATAPSVEAARALLGQLLAIERAFGRDRAEGAPGGPRTLDLDLLLWGDLRVDDPGPPRLMLPHPRLGERAFVLAPLVELAGDDMVLPGGQRAGELLARALADPLQAVEKMGV